MTTLDKINHLHPSLTAPFGRWEPCRMEDVLKRCVSFKPERFPKPIVEVDQNGDYQQVGVLFTFGEPLKAEYGIRVLKDSRNFVVMAVSMATCDLLFPPMSCSPLALEGYLFRLYEGLEAFDEHGKGYQNILHELFGIFGEIVDKDFYTG